MSQNEDKILCVSRNGNFSYVKEPENEAFVVM